MKLRLGIIGLSKDWNSRHLPALRLLTERFEVCGIYNSVSSIAANASREFGARQYDGFREMLSSDDIDAVLFLESGWYGTAPIVAACEFGKAIFCGSEIEIASDQASALKSIVEESGVAFMAEFQRRLAPASLRLKELIATRLGQPEIIFCHRRLSSPSNASGSSSVCEKKLMERELVELMDWCAFVAGRPIRRIQGSRHYSAGKSKTDYVSLSLELSSGSCEPDADGNKLDTTVAQISCGSYIPANWLEASNFRPPAGMQVCCENGLAFLDLPNSLIWFDDAGRHQESLEAEMSVGQQLLTQFHRAVTSLVRKMADLEDVYSGLRALQIAEESISQGCGVELTSAETRD